jgi:hypothetical protein
MAVVRRPFDPVGRGAPPYAGQQGRDGGDFQQGRPAALPTEAVEQREQGFEHHKLSHQRQRQAAAGAVPQGVADHTGADGDGDADGGKAQPGFVALRHR